MITFLNRILILSILFFLILGTFISKAQDLPDGSQVSNTVQQEISGRERQIQELETQKEAYQKQIQEKQQEVRTLESEVFILDTEIKQIQVEIKTIDVAIQKTNFEIEQTTTEIEAAQAKTEKLKESLAEFLRLVNESDQETLLAILLKNREISDFFGNLEGIRVSQEKAQFTIAELKQLKIELEEKQEELEAKRQEQFDLRRIQEVEKNEVDSKKKEVNTILKVTRGDEKKFQALVKETEKNIQVLKEQIQFLLAQGITLEEAIRYGHLAAISTGIRPAFLLAILETESKLGANVGKCYITDTSSGVSRHVSNGRLFTRGINPRRDLPIFLDITRSLGKDPLSTPISCWIPLYTSRGVSIGWGGGMGPAQFIPSTWVILDNQVAGITGRSPADPWNIEDAFLASALLLSKGGATSQTYAAEVRAAKAYFSGSPNCSRADCRSYASAVMRNAAEIQKQLPAIP